MNVETPRERNKTKIENERSNTHDELKEQMEAEEEMASIFSNSSQ